MIATCKTIQLPELEAYNPFQSNSQHIRSEDVRMDELLHRLVEYLSTRFSKWKIDSEFSFELPESQFDHKRDKPIITYLQPDAVQDEGMVGPLTAEQLQGIKTSGVFTVSSRRYAIPYQWKITDWLQKGTERIQQSLYEGLGNVFFTLYEAQCSMNIKDELRGIWKNIQHIGMLFVGLKSVNVHVDTEKILCELEKKRQKEVFKNHAGKFSLALVEYLDVPIGLEGDALKEKQTIVAARIQQLSQLSSELLSQWTSQKERIVEELEDKFPTQRLKEEVERYQHQMFVNLVMGKAHLEERIKLQLVELMEQYHIINDTVAEKGKRQSDALNNISQQIATDFPIRKHSSRWFNTMYYKFSQEITKREEDWMLDQLKRRLSTVFFEDYVHHYKTYDEEYKRLALRLGTTETPTGSFTQGYGLFAPYRLDYLPESATYTIETYKSKTVDTSSNFWKLMLWWVRLICGFRQVFYVLVRNIWAGDLGIRILFGRTKFYPEYLLNGSTGELGRNPNHERIPILVGIGSKLRLISRLREKFDSAPNSGLFDKRTARVFHLLHCYFVIFLLQIVVYCCILKPLLVLLNIVVSLALIVTMPVWLPILCVVLYCLDIFLFNFDHQSRYSSYDRVNWFPFMRFALRAVFTVLLILLKLTVVPLFFLTIGLIVFLWSSLRYACRKAYDAALFQLIKAIGRSPVTDSGVAWKIAGPGITGSYYQSIKSTDIYVLVTAQLEKIHLEMFQNEVTKLLQKPQQQANSINKIVIDRLKGGSLQLYKINESINYYTQRIYKQIQERTNVFPSSPGHNVRFTEQQMLSFTKITKEILDAYHEKYPELDMFKHFSIRRKNQNKLVRLIWQGIFQNTQVFNTLHQNEIRFDAMKEEEECDEAGHLADRIRVTTAAAATSQRKEGISHSVFTALESQDQLLAIYPKDCAVNQLVYTISRFTGSQLPSSKHELHLSIMLNPNIPRIE